MLMSAYKRLKCALGWQRNKGTVKVRAFRHAKSRQVTVGDRTPIGMISEWKYNACDDSYNYPQGHERIGELKGFELGTSNCSGLTRIEQDVRQFMPKESYHGKGTSSKDKSAPDKLAFIGLDSRGFLNGTEVGLVQWFFEVAAGEMDADTSPIYALKVRSDCYSLTYTFVSAMCQWESVHFLRVSLNRPSLL